MGSKPSVRTFAAADKRPADPARSRSGLRPKVTPPPSGQEDATLVEFDDDATPLEAEPFHHDANEDLPTRVVEITPTITSEADLAIRQRAETLAASADLLDANDDDDDTYALAFAIRQRAETLAADEDDEEDEDDDLETAPGPPSIITAAAPPQSSIQRAHVDIVKADGVRILCVDGKEVDRVRVASYAFAEEDAAAADALEHAARHQVVPAVQPVLPVVPVRIPRANSNSNSSSSSSRIPPSSSPRIATGSLPFLPPPIVRRAFISALQGQSEPVKDRRLVFILVTLLITITAAAGAGLVAMSIWR